jgi:glycosyltransferase involved in cell wall biosynthesis
MTDCLRPGGAEGQIVLLCRALQESGWRVRVACLNKAGWHVSDLGSLGIDPFEVPLAPSLLRPNTLWQVERLARYVRAEGVDVIHAHDLYTNMIAMAAGRRTDVPVVVSRLDQAHWFSGIRRRTMAMLQQHAAAVFSNARAITQMLVNEEGLERGRISQVPNGIDLVRFDAEAALPPDPAVPELSPRSVIMVANMVHPVKGHPDLIFAADEVLRRWPDVRFLLVGQGALRPGLERLVAQLGRRREIVFLGGRRDVPRLLARAGVAVSASLAEGLSNSIIEAMAAGLPVVATAVGGNAELVGGQRGMLVPPNQPSLLAARLCELLGDDRRRLLMGHAARCFVEANLTLDRMGRAFDALYRHVVEHHQQPEGRFPVPEPAALPVDGERVEEAYRLQVAG